MGNLLDRSSGTKRKRENSESVEESPVLDVKPGDNKSDSLLHTPKRKRIKSTSKYIYQTLFLDGENSDICIVALGRNWKLHKLYLSQSPYFSCMFNGSWKESNLEEIVIDIVDPAIDEEALKIAFGSLYKDYVFIKPVQMSGVLAAATLLQLEGLIEQCTSLMKDTVSVSTVCSYYEASMRYGVETVNQDCFNWLLTNLLSNENPDLLKGISEELMSKMIASPYLYVMQVEMDIYSMLKKWLFLQLNNSWSGSHKDLDTESDAYFREYSENKPVLASDEGLKFLSPFKNIRWQYLLTDLASLNILKKDFIIHMDWIKSGYEFHWRQMLRLEQGQELGPKDPPDPEVFNRSSLRCGRILQREGEYCWRWVGYSYGFDLLITYVHGLVMLKRNTFSQSCPHAVSLQPKRYLAYRLTISCLDADGKIKTTKSTDINHICLSQDEEVVAMKVPREMEFPLHLSMNILLVTVAESGDPPVVLNTSVHQSCDVSVQTNKSELEEVTEISTHHQQIG